jgi:hypothetical protein
MLGSSKKGNRKGDSAVVGGKRITVHTKIRSDQLRPAHTFALVLGSPGLSGGLGSMARQSNFASTCSGMARLSSADV